MRTLPHDTAQSATALPRPLVWGVILISVLPLLLHLMGLNFGTGSRPLDQTPLSALPAPALVDVMHRTLAGSFTHTILEWSAFCTAIFTVIFAFIHFGITRNVTTPVIGLALFCAGCMDAFHTLAADRLIEVVAENRNLIPFTWALCRIFNALIMIVGVGLFVIRPTAMRQWGVGFIVGVSVVFGVTAYGIIHVCATQATLPETMFPNALITRPYDIAPLLLFLFAGLVVYPRFHRLAPSLFSSALLLSVVPEIATQLHMAFGSAALFDPHFNIAHFLKIMAYLVPFAGLGLDYVHTYQEQQHARAALEHEIVERKQTEAALRESEERFVLAEQGTSDGLWDWNVVTNETYFSPRFKELLGYAEDELPNEYATFEGHLHPDDLPQMQAGLQAHLEHRQPFDMEYRLRTKQGEYGWFSSRGQALRDETGQPLRMAGSIRDITERKQAEEVLRVSEERFRTLSTASPVGLFQNDAQGACTYTNTRWQEIFGLSLEDSLGDTWTKAIVEEDRAELLAAWKHSVQVQGKFMQDYRILRADGQERWIHAQAAMRYADSGVLIGAVGTAEDITERKQAEEEILRYTQEVEEARARVEAQAEILTKQTKELARSNTELEQFAYISSHDLQEPLRKIQAFGDRLKTKYAAALDERGLDYLERMRSSAQRMQTLIQDLLTYSRVTSKASSFVSVDLTALAQEVVADLEVRIEDTRGRVEVGDLPTLAADPTQLRQLLQNLIGNALKFHRPEVPPEVTVQLRPALAGTPANADPPTSYQITVQDNGIGFEEEYNEQIFAPFQRLHGRGEYEGTGIGLAVCRKIVRRHGGDITVSSAPGQGSTFTFTLPVSPPAGDEQLV